MSRRALPKIDPGLDLSGRLLSMEQLPQPWDTAAIFGRLARFEVEVGSGKGLFLTSAAAAQPDGDFLGVEVSNKYAQFAAARLTQRGLTNARILHGDALRLFAERLPDEILAAVHVYFPDPWWKARHKKRRVMKESFLRDVRRTLAPGGKLHFWTDVEEYFITTLELIAAVGGLQGPFDVPELDPRHDLDYRTHFERRMRLHGQPVYRAEFRKGSAV